MNKTETNDNVKYIDFGERLELILAKLNLTQTLFVKATGIPTTTFNNYINGKNEPSARCLYRISKYLGVTIDELIEGTNLTDIGEDKIEPLVDFNLKGLENAIVEKH